MLNLEVPGGISSLSFGFLGVFFLFFVFSSLSFGSPLLPPRLLLQGFIQGVLERSPSLFPCFRNGKGR